MKKNLKKSGQKIIRKLSRASQEASDKSKTHIKEHFIARVSNIKNVRLWILEWSLLVLVVILFAVIQAIWYSNSYETKTYAAGGTYTEATLGQVNSMNPLYAVTSSEKTLARLLFSSLVSVDVSGHLNNDLAESISVDDTGLTWTIKLRDHMSWSDGQAITAEDVVFSFNLINNSSARTSVSTGFTNTKINQTDNLTVQFTLPTIYAAFYDALDFPILPAHILGEIDPALVYEHDFSTNPITSGPFTLNAVQSSPSGKTIYLNKNPDYHQGEPMLNSFVIKTYGTSTDIVNSLNHSEVTASADLSSIIDPKITNSSIFTKKTATNNGAFAFLNTTSATLSDVKVRQAIAKGIDMQSLRQDLIEESILDFPILSQQIDIQNPEVTAYNYDAAIELLKNAGYTKSEDSATLLNAEGSQPKLYIATVNTAYLPELAKRISEQLTALGFSTEVEVYEIETSAQEFLTNIIRPRNYDILLYEVDMGIDPDLFPYYHSSQANSSGFNFSNYKNSIVDDLLLSARTTFDTSLRKAKYRSFLEYWLRDVPAIGLYRVELTYYFNHAARTFSENNTLSSGLDRFSDLLYWATEKTNTYRTP